jgi:hypothetical protein
MPNTDYNKSKTTANVEYLNYLGGVVTNDARRTGDFKSRIIKAKAVFNNNSLHQQIGLKFEEKTSETLHLDHSFVRWMKLGHFVKYIRNTLKFGNVVLEKIGD